jgi:hypothetical protein
MLVVVSDQVQGPVHDEMSPVGPQTLALLTGFRPQDLRTDHQVSERPVRAPGRELDSRK